jgi:hypothetical protein
MTVDFSGVRRNDPCPCGSGKKFKKCCFQKQLIQQQTERETISLDKFIDADQNPYLWFKGIRQIVNRRDWKLLYEAFAKGSAVKERFPNVESFIEVARESSDNAPFGGEVELRRFRLLGDTIWIMVARGLDDRRRNYVEFEVVGARMAEEGFLITDFERKNIDKVEGVAPDAEFVDFASVQAAYADAKKGEWERPIIARWDTETQQMLNPDGTPVEIEEPEEPEEPEASEADGSDAAADAEAGPETAASEAGPAADT